MVRSPDGNTNFFDILAGVLQGDTLAPYIFVICLDCVLRTSADAHNELGLTLEVEDILIRRSPMQTMLIVHLPRGNIESQKRTSTL